MQSIGIVVENFEYGGVMRHLEYLLNSDIFSKHNITIFTNKNNKKIHFFKNRITNKKINIVLYNCYTTIFFRNFFLKIFFHIFRPLFFLLSIFQFIFIFSKNNVDLILFNCGGFGSFRSEVAAIISAKFLNKKKIFILIHHCYSKPIFWAITVKIFNLISLSFVKKIIFVSKVTKNNILKNIFFYKLFKKKTVIIPNGIFLFSKSKKNSFRIIKDPKKINILMLSRINPEKGHEDLIEAMHLINEDIRKKINIYIVGTGKKRYVDFLREKIRLYNLNKYFFIKGFLNIDSQLLISQFDLFLSLTRDFEGFGYSILEAASVKKPILNTNLGLENKFFFKNSNNLVKIKNHNDLKKKIILFLNKKKKFKKEALKTYAKVTMNFQMNSLAQKYFKVFKIRN